MFTEPTPSITAAQIAALVTFVVGQLVAWGWITDGSAQLAVSIGSTVLAAAWKLADAYLRGQRARALAGRSTTPPATGLVK